MNPVAADAFMPAGGTPNTFQANDGDTLVETTVQINPTGTSPASVPVTFVVAPGAVAPAVPVGVLPVAPVIGSNTIA